MAERMALSQTFSMVSQFSVRRYRHKIMRLVKRASPVFPQVIVATCLPGYALNETAHDDNKYYVKCHADASFGYSHHTIGKSTSAFQIVVANRLKSLTVE